MSSAAAAARARWPRALAWVLAAPLLLPVLWLASAFATAQPEVWPHLFEQVLPAATRNTLALLALLAVFALLPGVGFAWASARFEFPGRRFFDWALVLPLALPGYVVAFVYVGLADYAGPLQSAWRAFGGSPSGFPELRSVPGAAAVLALVLYPYVFLVMRAAFLRQGSAAMDAARSLGHGPVAAFFRAALPMARPAWVAGLTLVLLEALADFGAVSILGVDTLATAVYKTWFGLYSLPAACAASGLSSSSTLARAFGPCTATMARSRRSLMATPNGAACAVIQARSLSRVAALTTRRKKSSAR